MSLDEARQILGVSNNTSRDEIMKAFKRLMLINHPDKGGTQYIATKIIQARKTLLGE
jgi:DnaJ-class molecular chaperone